MNLDLKSYKGTRDIYPEDMRVRNYIFGTFKNVFERFGYEEYQAPILEPLELYAAKTGEEIVNEQTYSFLDRGGRKVAIRPEMTPTIARMVAARRQEMPYPARLYSIANFMRYEQPQKGREREFWQLNYDVFGSDSLKTDTEIISLADAVMKAFGAKENMYTIKVNDRKLVDWLMREYLKLENDKAIGMMKLLDRRAKMSAEDFNKIAMEIVGEQNLGRVLDMFNVESLKDAPKWLIDSGKIDDIRTVTEKLNKLGIKVEFDITLMRGFDYYTGIVFEVYDNNPENNRSMYGGGRYDGLVGLFGVENLPVAGAAIGETTMIEFLKAWNLLPKLAPATRIFVIELGEADANEIVASLRSRGINTAVESINRKLDKTIKSAAKMGIEYVLFVGENEIKSGKYNLKNIITGAEETLDIDEIAKKVL